MPGFQNISLKFAETPVKGNFHLLKTYNSFFLKFEMGKMWNLITRFTDKTGF